MNETTETIFSFGEFELDTVKRLLLKSGQPVTIKPKAFDLLTALVEKRGQVLSKDELLETVWENQFVEENNLSVHIFALRRIFGEKKDEHQFIVTVPGKGYKFVAGDASLATTNQASKPETRLFVGGEEIIGRAKEIAEIKSILRASDKCLLTLTGAGGSGKTKLARTIADECRTEFEDGVFFIELAAVGRAESVAGAIAQVFDLKESGGKSALDALKDFLRERRILLILDNFEQLLSAASSVKEILDSAEHLKILVTSRAPLRLKIEQEKVVLPLAVPPPNSNLSAEQLSAYAAIELFAVRAQKTKSNFALSEENASVVAEICSRLDGLPLAIELAAARVKLLSPQAILERLGNSLKLLTGGASDLPERQRTMRDTIRWSYDLLGEDEKILFRRAAVFAGGFTVEAAEAIYEECELKDEQFSVPQSEVLDSLSALVDSNLLVSKEQADGNARLRMLEVVREFALEQFQKLDDTETLRHIHARYFLALAEEAEEFLQGEAGNDWLEKLEIEHDNLRGALEWSLKNEPQTAARIAAALRFFWLNHSHFSEGLRWSKAALQTTENSSSEARCKLLMSNGLFLKSHGEFEAARKSYEKCSAESRETNDSVHIVKANHGLAAVAVLQRDFAAAQKFLAEALALSRKLGDELQIAHSLGSIGDLEMCRENLSAARPPLEECLSLAKKLGNERNLTTVYFNLGTIDYLESFYESAAFNFAESLRIAERMGNKTMIACALDGFAALGAVSGNHEQSARLAGAAEALREEIGCPLEPAEEIFREKYLAKTRVALNEKASALLYAQGRALNPEQAVALAKQIINDRDTGEIPDFNEMVEEIIVEKHSFSRVVIEETIE
jgi:predicted ATPase/DNA-binding winged helix-turn-helix (wHTH) protein